MTAIKPHEVHMKVLFRHTKVMNTSSLASTKMTFLLYLNLFLSLAVAGPFYTRRRQVETFRVAVGGRLLLRQQLWRPGYAEGVASATSALVNSVDPAALEAHVLDRLPPPSFLAGSGSDAAASCTDISSSSISSSSVAGCWLATPKVVRLLQYLHCQCLLSQSTSTSRAAAGSGGVASASDRETLATDDADGGASSRGNDDEDAAPAISSVAANGSHWACMVFTERRLSATVLAALLQRLQRLSRVLRCAAITGVAAAGGTAAADLKEQRSRLRAFRAGGLNVLLSTSVAEEGIDVRQCQLVVR